MSKLNSKKNLSKEKKRRKKETHEQCFTPVIPELGRLKEEDGENETSMGYIVRPLPKTQTNKNQKKR
jgi:hypothetical protein